ncbi:MAG: SGNH/GDSL hydrolase family protein [Tumebacillaceae bacterium]
MIFYTALGDSITFGHSASSPCRAYPSLLRAELQTRGGAVVEVVAEPGWTSGALNATVLGDGALELMPRSSVVTIWVGGNDLAYAGLRLLRSGQTGAGAQQALAGTFAAYGRNVAVLVAAVRRVSQAQILLCTQYNPFPHSPLAAQGVGALNQATFAAASQLNVQVAPVHEWFAGQEAALIAGYRSGRLEDALRSPRLPIHPDDAGHAVIASGLARLIR